MHFLYACHFGRCFLRYYTPGMELEIDNLYFSILSISMVFIYDVIFSFGILTPRLRQPELQGALCTQKLDIVRRSVKGKFRVLT